MFRYEGRFHSDGVGVDFASGMTFDGTAIHPDTLLPQVRCRMQLPAVGHSRAPPHWHSAAGQRTPQLQRAQQRGAAPHFARPRSGG
jgi:hypothetical protein